MLLGQETEAKMNRERLIELAEWLEAGAPHKDGVDKFDMEVGIAYSSCGTACCIAGAATQFFGGERGKELAREAREDYEVEVEFDEYARGEACFYGSRGPLSYAIELLELDTDQARSLFIPRDSVDGIEFDNNQITPEWAGRTVRHLIETGKVDWRATKDA